MKTLRVYPENLCHAKQESLACGIASQSRKPLGSQMMMYARLVSALDRAFKGEEYLNIQERRELHET